MKIVVISPRFPYPLEKGDKLRLYHQIRLLSQDYEIVLISLSDTKISKNDIRQLEPFVSKVYTLPLKKIWIFFRLIFGVFNRKPFQVLYFFNKRHKKKIETIIRKENPDFIYNQLIRSAEYSRDLDYMKILDYMDSFSEGMRKRFDNSSFIFKLFYKEEYRRVKRYEEEVFKDFDRHSIISIQDREKFSPDIKEKINLVPNGVDMDFFKSRGREKRYNIGFVGNMGYRPNIVACEYFAKNILPGLKEKKPDVKIIFAGARPHSRVKALNNKNIFVSGWLEDIRDAYEECEIFVAPIFTGIGQQNKILEAMSMQIPVITTHIVNNAIGAIPEKEILIANSDKEFIDLIIRLMEDSDYARKIGLKGKEFIKNNYSWNSQYIKLKQLFE